MVHRKCQLGYWGCNVNHDRTLVLLTTGDDDQQARICLNVKQAEAVIEELQKAIAQVKEPTDE